MQSSFRAIVRSATARRQLHTRVGLPYPIENGLEPFLSPVALERIAVEWQQGVLDRLTTLVRGTPLEGLSVVQTLIQSAQDPSLSLTFNYASEALNNSFFLSTLARCACTPGHLLTSAQKHPSTGPSAPSPSSGFTSALDRSSLKSLPGLISSFSAHVAGLHPSSGAYMWLITDTKGNLGIVGTYAGGSLLVQGREQRMKTFTEGGILGEPTKSIEEGAPTEKKVLSAASAAAIEMRANEVTASFAAPAASKPLGQMSNLIKDSGASFAATNMTTTTYYPLLCLSLGAHTYAAEYGIWGREEYVKNWWSCVEWKRVEESWRDIVGSNTGA